MNCPGCGTASARPDQRFCVKCGTNLAPVEPPSAYGQGTRITGPLFADDVGPPWPPPPAAPTHAVAPEPYRPVAPPPPYDDRGRRRRTSIVLLVAAAVVAALIGAGGVVLLLGGADSPTDTSAGDRSDDGDLKGAGEADPRTDAGSSAPPTPSPTKTSTPARFRCWDGGTVVRLSACVPPSGALGMAWVFPSSTGSTCSTEAGVERASEAECAPAVGEDPVRFHYSEWRSRSGLETYYGGNTLETIAAPGGRDDLAAAQVVSRDPSVGYKVAVYYADPAALWSVTIYAADQAQYEAAVEVLEMRPFGLLRGERG